MWTSNNALVPDLNKEPDNLTSDPIEWPLLSKGLRMCGWGDKEIKVYLMGNPLIWWGAIAGLLLLIAYSTFNALIWQRGYSIFKTCKLEHTSGPTIDSIQSLSNILQCTNPPYVFYDGSLADEMNDIIFTIYFCFGGWFLHYFPFGLMGRVTYLHHYFPALYFGIFALTSSAELLGKKAINLFFGDKLTIKSRSLIAKSSLIAIGIACMISFIYFAPLSYGFDGPASYYADRKWLSSWTMA